MEKNMTVKDKTIAVPTDYHACERGNVYLAQEDGCGNVSRIAWFGVKGDTRLEVSVAPGNYPAINVRMVELSDEQLFHHIRRKLIGWYGHKINLGDYEITLEQDGLVADTRARPSEQMARFFETEWDNEKHGGQSPSTLQSAKDSLVQMPTDILCETVEEDYDDFDRKDFEHELETLIADWRKDTDLHELFD